MSKLSHQLTFSIALAASLLLNTLFTQVSLAAKLEHKLEAALIYKISKFVFWPKEAPIQGAFGICILGSSSMFDSLAILKKRTIKKYPIKTYLLNFSKEVDKKCQILFVDPSRKAFVKIIVKQLDALNKNQQAILTLSTLPNFAKQGGMIEFSIDKKPISFYVNLAQTKKATFEISSTLLKIATIVSNEVSKD